MSRWQDFLDRKNDGGVSRAGGAGAGADAGAGTGWILFLGGRTDGGMADGLQTVDLIIFHDLIATLMQEQTRPD